jgi:hypothetical protein
MVWLFGCSIVVAVRKDFAHRKHVTAPNSICHARRGCRLPTPHRAAKPGSQCTLPPLNKVAFMVRVYWWLMDS